MKVKIKSVSRETVYFITTEDGQHFRRDAIGHWEQLYGDTWEPADAEHIEQPLEQAFQEFMTNGPQYHIAPNPPCIEIGGHRTTISPHQVRCFLALKMTTGWLTNADIAQRAKVSERCARAYSKLFVEQGLVDRLPVFQSHQFRWRRDADIRNPAALAVLEQAASVFHSRGLLHLDV